MTKTINLKDRILSVFLCVALLITCLPLGALHTSAVTAATTVGAVTDPGTADTWQDMMGTDQDGNRYSGRVWADKSVYKNGDIAVLSDNSSFQVSLEENEAFQIIFSALGSSMTTSETTVTVGPMDVVLVLDTSTSMDDEDNQGVTRLERIIEAANGLIDDLLTIPGTRVAIVTYNKDSETLLALNQYSQGINLVVTDYYNNGSSDAGIVYAYNDNNQLLGQDSGYTQGTNLQSGIDRGFNILANATNVEGRNPVAIVLTDGQANRASQEGFYEIASHSDQDGNGVSNRNLYLSTLLNAAYTKTKIEKNYSKEAIVYTVGVDVTTNSVARLLMNPADPTNGFNDYGNDRTRYEITQAYRNFQTWATGQSVSYSNWTFDHNYPTQNGAITPAKIAANIDYADVYYDVTNAEVQSAFQQIFEELTSGVFNPISSTTTLDGGTGVENTPLIYVDFIGQHMQIKEIEAVTLFGASYSVVNNGDGTYTVAEATGINPTTSEAWNTAEDIRISVTQENGVQKLQIEIDQEILPIILEQAISNTVGDTTSATITEFTYDPLRVYYTVGIASDVLLPNGQIDVSKIQGYSHIDDASGTICLYANQFGVMNPEQNGTLTQGDAHVGFRPSKANRYYYHQSNQGIFSQVTSTDGSAIDWDASEYGVEYEEGKFNLTWVSYDQYKTLQADDQVYTYVTYYRPTASSSDAANAAEEVTYLIYMDWRYLKESVAFYDAANDVYVNYDAAAGYVTADSGIAMDESLVETTLAAYMAEVSNAQLYAVLGVGSVRTSRLHNMEKAKTENTTGTATQGYSPEYTHETATIHNNNDVVVWLGNNGRLTTIIDTGIALSKTVTEAIGNADDRYELTVTIPDGVIADPKVVDAQGNLVAAPYQNQVLTVSVKAGETVYISGIPSGTICTIGENIDGDYYIASQTDTVTVPYISDVLNGAAQFAPARVTNAPYKYGNLFITKELESNHTIPESIYKQEFTLVVNLGAALAGKTFAVEDSARATPYQVTADDQGALTFTIRARQTIEILHLPEGTEVTVTEIAPGSNYQVAYRTRNHSGEAADDDNKLTIPANANATAVITNVYTPVAVNVDLDISITKNFVAETGAILPGDVFKFEVQRWDAQNQVWETLQTGSLDYAANETGIKTFTVSDVLSGITYTQIGTWAYQVVEIPGTVDSITYDRAQYTFTVTVTDNGGQLVATVTDLHNNTIGNTYDVTFVNTYHTVPIWVDIIKDVTDRSGANEASKSGFGFTATQTDDSWNVLSGGKVFEVYTDASGHARITDACSAAGSYYYILRENIPANATLITDGQYAGMYEWNGWYYDDTEYKVEVVVSRNQSTGDLTATIIVDGVDMQSNGASVQFANIYDPEDVALDLDGAVMKELTGKTLKAGMFTFYLCADGKSAAVLNGTENPILVGTNELNGDVKFVNFDEELLFAAVGIYRYDVVEAIPTGAIYDTDTEKYVLNGMHYDSTIYDLVVEVTNDAVAGKLVANWYFEDATGPVVTFHNAYILTPTEYSITGLKVLSGRAVRAGEFTFGLYEGDTLLETVTNKADGSFYFNTIEYLQPGVYTYTVKEILQGQPIPGISYDGVNAPITITVTVEDVNGTLVATADVPKENVVFHNTYTAAAAEVTFQGTKTLQGGNLADGDFTFKLYETDHNFTISGAALQTVQNVGGSFLFDTIAFTQPGTYFYVVTEDAEDPMENVVYDSTRYCFSVQVRDVGDGQLYATVMNVNTGISQANLAEVTAEVTFVNAMFDEVTEKEVYGGQDLITHIDGQKVNVGEKLTYFITYTNYTGKDVVVDIMDTIPDYTTYVDGTASHGGSYVGTHILWTLNVARGQSVTVSFQVEVTETNAIVANTAYVRDGVNTYTTNEVVNHTYENSAEKDVFYPSEPSVSIDGRKVYQGQELLYKIRFTNTTGQTVSVKIGDMIPAYTTYVDSSADNGGQFDGSQILWKLNDIPAWETVTVSFRVVVNSDIGAQNIDNQATVEVAGGNTFTTEFTHNYTVHDEVKKEVFKPSDLVANLDGQQVAAGDALAYAITYKNTSLETVTVTITDTVPSNTTYVEGSADHNGSYNEGVITWTLEVEAGESVTVMFQVTVNDVDDVQITNEALVTEGSNVYTTNEVMNEMPEQPEPTELEPTEPEPTEPDPTEPEPTEPEPTEPDPTEPEPTEPEPTEPEPTEPEPTEPEPTESEPTEPEPTESEPTEPEPAESDPTEPEPTEPEPAESEPTEPEPTEPEPTEPEPTESDPTEPKPTEPDPTEPDPTVPEPPKTSDPTSLGMWFAALFVSCGGFITTAVLGNRKKEEDQF